MNVFSQGLKFLKRGVKTQTALAKLTGVPRSTVSFVLRGVRELPAKYNDTVFDLYRDRAWGEMYASGFPEWDISNQLTKSPDTIGANIDYWNDTVNRWATNRAVTTAANNNIILSEDELEELTSEYADTIRDSFSESERSFDDIRHTSG